MILPARLPAVARSVVEGIGSVGSVHAILGNRLGGVVGVPKLLEGDEVLLGDVLGCHVVEVHRVGVGVTVHPTGVLQSGQPVAVIRGVHRTASFVVTGAGHRRQADATNTSVVPVVEQVLLRGRAESRVQGDVIVLALGGSGEVIRSRGLQFIHARTRALNPGRIKCFESVAHLFQFGNNFIGHALSNGRTASNLCAEDARRSGVRAMRGNESDADGSNSANKRQIHNFFDEDLSTLKMKWQASFNTKRAKPTKCPLMKKSVYSYEESNRISISKVCIRTCCICSV